MSFIVVQVRMNKVFTFLHDFCKMRVIIDYILEKIKILQNSTKIVGPSVVANTGGAGILQEAALACASRKQRLDTVAVLL